VLVFAPATLSMHPELEILLVEHERDGNELVAVAVVARYHNTRIANLHLGLSILSDSVDTE
jgi:hypothetical protein